MATRWAEIAASLLVVFSTTEPAAGATALEDTDFANQDDVLVRRLDAVSRELLGAPYQLGPLGEEREPDLDPRFRLDAFDCTTYVETVLALTMAQAVAGNTVPPAHADGEAARLALDRIRYTRAEPTFERRRHLIEAQWIPELVAEGFLIDVTGVVGHGAERKASIELRRRSWERSKLALQLGLPWSAVPAGRHSLPYLPWKSFDDERLRRALPSAAVLSVVVTPAPDTPILVIHQGLMLRAPGGDLVVRHASSLYRAVVEEPLEAFLDHARGRKRFETLGVNVLAIGGAAWPTAATEEPTGLSTAAPAR
jgi:hypothetical protein